MVKRAEKRRDKRVSKMPANPRKKIQKNSHRTREGWLELRNEDGHERLMG